MAYLDLRIFLTFHTCGLTALESKLTAVAWRAKKVEAVALKTAELFQRALRFFLMAHTEFPLVAQAEEKILVSFFRR